MNVPWGMIHAQRETAEYKEKLADLWRKVNKALKLPKIENPDIELVIRVLEEKGRSLFYLFPPCRPRGFG